METLKPRKTSKGKQTSKKKGAAVKSMPKGRIGANQGLIMSNQRVPRPKKGSVQYRRSIYGEVSAADKVWIGGSSIGQETTHFRTIAHAILAHYLPKMGDMRASNTEIAVEPAVFLSYRVKYSKDAPPSTQLGTQFADGAVLANQSMESMATALGAEFAQRAKSGFYPNTIAFFETLTAVPGDICALRDNQLGRHKITVAIKGRFRFQNVTHPDSSSNINAVDANAISGKIYTFRNQAPLYAATYVEALSQTPGTTAQIAAIKELQRVTGSFEMYGTLVGTGGKGGGAFTPIPAPPLNPASLWRNVSSTGQVVFPPGGFKTYQTSYLRSESIAKYVQSISQAEENVPTLTYSHNTPYPPAGDSFMMCLRPTIKTSSEDIKVAYDSEYILTASIQRRRASPLQVVNDIEKDPAP